MWLRDDDCIVRCDKKEEKQSCKKFSLTMSGAASILGYCGNL